MVSSAYILAPRRMRSASLWLNKSMRLTQRTQRQVETGSSSRSRRWNWVMGFGTWPAGVVTYVQTLFPNVIASCPASHIFPMCKLLNDGPSHLTPHHGDRREFGRPSSHTASPFVRQRSREHGGGILHKQTTRIHTLPTLNTGYYIHGCKEKVHSHLRLYCSL